jgi:hypothetical protein
MLDEGIKAVHTDRKKQRYAFARRNSGRQIKVQRYMVTRNPSSVDIADCFQVACQKRRNATQVCGLALGDSLH